MSRSGRCPRERWCAAHRCSRRSRSRSVTVGAPGSRHPTKMGSEAISSFPSMRMVRVHSAAIVRMCPATLIKMIDAIMARREAKQERFHTINRDDQCLGVLAVEAPGRPHSSNVSSVAAAVPSPRHPQGHPRHVTAGAAGCSWLAGDGRAACAALAGLSPHGRR